MHVGILYRRFIACHRLITSTISHSNDDYIIIIYSLVRITSHRSPPSANTF